MTLITLTIATAMMVGMAAAQTVNFDDLKAGASPPGWTGTQTGSGHAKWSIERTLPRRANLTS